MNPIARIVGVTLSFLAVLVLTGCGGGGPAAKIGDLSIDTYVALGDGYAAAPYSGPTEPAKGCLRSASSYPALLAEEIDAKEFVDATCAFARTQDLTRAAQPERGEEGPVPAQLDQLGKDTELVTLTIGLGDRDFWERLLQVCAAPCEEDEGVPVDELGADLHRIAGSVERALDTIAERAPEARVIFVGYPTLLPPEGRCKAMPEMSQDRADLVNAVMGQLASSLRQAARNSGADYLDAAELSTGHDLCAGEPWVNGRTTGPQKAPRFHPLAELNEAIAEKLAADLEP